jgi:hypothetical protein
VIFLGARQDVGDILATFDCLCMPSESEACSLAANEAWAAGVPLISTRVGLLEDHPHLARLIANPATPGDLAAAILADHADRRGTAARVARAREFAARELTPGRFGREWTDFLLEVAGPVESPNLADCGDGVWIGDREGCDARPKGFGGVMHIWRGDPEGFGVCRHALGDGAGQPADELMVVWREDQGIGALAPAFAEILGYARRPGRLLIHCAAGVSRSPALVLAAKLARGCDPDRAVAEIREAIRRRGRRLDWNPDAVAEILAHFGHRPSSAYLASDSPSFPMKAASPDGPPVARSATPGLAGQIDLMQRRRDCPHATKPPGCGCSDLVQCGRTGRAATRPECYECIRAGNNQEKILIPDGTP